MTQDSTRVIVPGHGRIWLGPVDSLPPGQILKVTGSPTQAVLALTVNGVTASATLKSTDSLQTRMLAIASTLAGLSSVGNGNVVVLPGPDVWTYLIVLDPSVAAPAISVTGTFTGGATPAAAIATTGRAADFSAYSEVGHTSQDSPLQVNISGGDVTSVGSWQQDNIDQSKAATSESLAFSLLQYDVPSMKLYYGSNAVVGPDGTVQASSSGPTATEQAMFLIVRNGAKAQPRHWPRVSISAADGENFDTTKLAEMPVQAALLSSNTLAYGKSISPVGVAA